MSYTAQASITPAFQLKGGLYTLTTLKLLSNELDLLEEQLNQKIQQAPNFFNKAPVVIDLRLVNQQSIDFKILKQILETKKLIIIGVRNANEEQQAQAMEYGFAILRDTPNPRANPSDAIVSNMVSNKTEAKAMASKLITTPVRSGQQIHAPEGDLVITAQVSNGAELLADGNIHVYGALRGRALAGVNGNTEARIFCQSLEAELISIAGQYKISEDIEKQAWKIPVEISLKEGHLQIREL